MRMFLQLLAIMVSVIGRLLPTAQDAKVQQKSPELTYFIQ